MIKESLNSKIAAQLLSHYPKNDFSLVCNYVVSKKTPAHKQELVKHSVNLKTILYMEKEKRASTFWLLISGSQ